MTHVVTAGHLCMPADAAHARAAYMAGSDQTEAGPHPADTQDVGVIDEQEALAVLYQKLGSWAG